MGSTGARCGETHGDIPAVARPGRFLHSENHPAAGAGSFLPSPHCHTAGCPNRTSGNLLPLLPRLERKAKPTMRSHPAMSPGCHLSHCGSLGEGWAQPREAALTPWSLCSCPGLCPQLGEHCWAALPAGWGCLVHHSSGPASPGNPGSSSSHLEAASEPG